MSQLQTKRMFRGRRRLLAERLEDRRLLAGPYAPAAGEIGSTAISKDDVSIVAWATAVENYTAGSDVDAEFQTPEKSVGPAEGSSGDAVSLGRGGELTLTFDAPIRDGLGSDFAVFENSFSDSFLELGFVEVSSDGINFIRFEQDSLTPAAVDAFGAVDPTEIHNLAGKYRQGFGTPFDLGELAGVSSLLNTTSVTHVRIVDVVGDGSQNDTSGDPIYDPFPTSGSAGFDLDAVGVIHQRELSRDVIGFEDVGATLAAGSAFRGPDPNGNTITGPFDDTVVVGSFQTETLTFNNAHSIDFGSWNQWAYANGTNTTTSGFTNQFSSFAGGGANGSPTFGIGFPDQTNFFDPPVISREAGDTRRFDSIMVTNTTYAALSMRDGDSFAKKFGGVSGDDPDFLLLTITGNDAGNVAVGVVEFYLADYRFADNSLDFIMDQWVEVDLEPIAEARSLEFAVTSSDVGPFGINTPAFFAVDDITLVRPVLAIDIADREVVESDGDDATMVRISRPDNDTSAAIDITLAAVDSRIADVPTSATIPIGESFVEFPIDVVNNELVDGDREIQIEASADGFVTTGRTLAIRDDDVRALTLTLEESSLAEGGSLVATVRRNDADLGESLNVQLETTKPSLLAFDGAVTIAANNTTATFTIMAVEDDLDRPNTDLSLTATAAGYIDSTVSLEVIDNDEPTVSIEVDPAAYSESDAAPSSRLEDVGRRLAPESFYNGADGAGGFRSEGIIYNNDFDPTFGSWSGWSYSNTTDTTTPGFTNQFSAITGGGAAGSDTYAVASTFSVPSIKRDPSSTDGFQSIEITNTTYAALSMRQGDDFAKKFGGESGNDPDFFLLTIEGVDQSESSVGTIEFYLADFRSADNSFDTIVDQWTTVDLSSLSSAIELRFTLTSSDVGDFGMNTPAYFALDNLKLVDQIPGPTVTLRRNVLDLSAELEVTLSSGDETEAQLPRTATIPTGESSVSVPLSIVDDAVVDGDQAFSLGVAAESHLSSSALLTVMDDDVRSLTLTIATPTVDESSGQGRAVVHRNIEDVSVPLDVHLSADIDDQLGFPLTATIPAGQRSIEFLFEVEDNSVVDGDRVVVVRATADGFTASEDSVSIIDEDVVPPTLSLELDAESLSESDAPPTILLEDFGAALAAESFDNGANMAGGFSSGAARFNNTYDPTFGSWGGWSVSNTTDRTTPGFGNQYSAITSGGANGSATYAVASAFPGGDAPTITIDPLEDGQSIRSLMVTNTAYAALSMAEGDDFAKEFGGESGNDPDYFLMTIEGFDDKEESVGTVEFYLADFRSTDNSQDYIIDEWTPVDVSVLDGAVQLAFSLSSSDVGEFGMNTPAYFAVDDVVLSSENPVVANGTVTRSDSDLTDPLVVNLTSSDAGEAIVSAKVVIPAGEASASFPIVAVDDAVLDGPQNVEIAVSAPTHTSSSETIVISDDEVAAWVVAESEGSTRVSEQLGSDEFTVTLRARPETEVVVDVMARGNGIALEPQRLVFRPSEWNQPQSVMVRGLPDLLLEENESVEITLAVHAEASDLLFASAANATVLAEVEDYQPSQVALRKEGSELVLVESDSSLEFQRSNEAGIIVVGNELSQGIMIDELEPFEGSIRVDAAGGDDNVELFGTRFDAIDGGAGHDRLTLAIQGQVDLVDMLSGRVAGFEEISPGDDTELVIDWQNLGSIANRDAAILITFERDQRISFLGDAKHAPPVMAGRVPQFAQVVAFGDLSVQFIGHAQWQNVLDQYDVNQSGDVTSLDALVVLNQLARITAAELPAIESLADFTGSFFDVSGDNLITSKDALRIINEMARQRLTRESEYVLASRLPNRSDAQPALRLELDSTVDSAAIKIFGGSAHQDAERADKAIGQLFGDTVANESEVAEILESFDAESTESLATRL